MPLGNLISLYVIKENTDLENVMPGKMNPITKDHILSDSFYMKAQNRPI